MMMTTGTLLHGPKVVWDIGVRKCIIEMISMTILNWVKGVREVICSHANMVHECQEWLNRS